MRLKLLAVFAITTVILFSISSNDVFAHYEEPLSGYGTATIDGVRSLGEWDGAQIIPVFGGKSESSMLLVMNDEENLYFGLYVIDNLLTPDDQVGIMFDNSHNGFLDVNDDSGGFVVIDTAIDGHFNGTEWIVDARSQGLAAGKNDGTRNFIEISKPLSSGDKDDINLEVGDVVGFCLTYVRDGLATDSTQFGPACRLLSNDQKLYGDIKIIPNSLVWHGLMAMDADKRNIDYGESIMYNGYLYGDNIIKGEPVEITISEQETRKIIYNQIVQPSLEPVEYFENTAWPFSFNVETSKSGYTDGMTYVVEAKYVNESTELNFLIKPDTKPELQDKATDAGKAIVEAGKETGELVIEAGKEAGKVIIDKGGETAEKGIIVGEVAVEKGKETGEIIAQKGSEGIEEIKEKGGGCLIATAAYGSELAPQVQFLREIRDNTVMSTGHGLAFMTGFNQIYYSVSPTIADMEREHPIFQESIRLFITPMISTLSIMALAEEGNELEVLGLGISVIVLNLAIYVGAPVVIVFGMKKKMKFFLQR